MTTHNTGTRDEWLAARLELLQAEKELTRRSDELARRRQALPWVRIDKAYRFETDEGSAAWADLFQGRSQLLVYHFMFGPDWTAGCPSCSSIADGFNGFVVHLAHHDVTLCAVSRAPLAKLQAYKRRMGWSFPWASSHGGDFNFDFNVQFTEEQQRERGIEYNYRREAALPSSAADGPAAEMAATVGTDVATYTRERPGMSAFVREEGVVYHTYSAYSRGEVNDDIRPAIAIKPFDSFHVDEIIFPAPRHKDIPAPAFSELFNYERAEKAASTSNDYSLRRPEAHLG